MIDEFPAVDTDEEKTYFQARAQWHRNRAELTSDTGARVLHRKFATLYEARAQS